MMIKSSASDTNMSFISRHMGEAEAPQQSRSRQVLHARVEFCPSANPLYGAINCLPHGNTHNTPKHSEISLLHPTSRKLGPVLLEIRQLESHNRSEFEDDYDVQPPNEKQTSIQYTAGFGYVGRLIAISRGIVSSSVTSTCLSFRKDHRWRNGDEVTDSVDLQCATGLSSGVLNVHTFKNLNSYIQNKATVLDSAFSDDSVVSYYQYHQRTNRPVSVVSWRNGAGADYSRHVALGLTGFNSAEKGLTSTQSGVGSSNVDREYCCMVWDIEGQSGAKGSKQSPLFRLAHNVGVSSLSWVEGGQLLAVGTQLKNVQLYDLRASGTNAPPISFAAHRDDVSGIEADPSRPSIFATFSKTPGESVKLWDLRKPDTFLSEIKVNVAVPGSSKLSSSTVSAISWNQINSVSLCIAAGDLLRYYDTNVSKPVLNKVTHMNEPVQSIAFRSKEISPTVHMPFERMIVVNMAGEVNDLPLEQMSPLAISHRDGRIIHAFGHNMWIYPSVKDPSTSIVNDDISLAIHRRAENLKNLKNFANARGIGSILSEEDYSSRELRCAQSTESNRQLSNVWKFIDRVETFMWNELGAHDESSIWGGRSLVDSGILRLLMKEDIEIISNEQIENISPFGFKSYDSPARRVALEICGWSLNDSNSFDEDNFERSAALAVWHGNIGEAVDIINRSSAYIRHLAESHMQKDSNRPLPLLTLNYAEALDLLSFCVAGYNSSAVWSQACSRLLHREEFNIANDRTYSPYIRALCTFLLHANDPNVSNFILRDENLSLVDRVAFACSFLDMNHMINFLNTCLERCLEDGNLEGVFLTGLDKMGFALLQSYVDKTSDVQTAAIMSSLVLLPNDWVLERALCSEWVDVYRDLLNRWQLWQFRAAFDVARAERVRKLKKHADDAASNLATMPGARTGMHHSRRANVNINNQIRKGNTIETSKQGDGDTTKFPPQVHARCNYCNTSLPLLMLRKNEKLANLFISRQKPTANDQKPILSCCPNPQCRKPLPRCAVCLLPLGCLNPYLEMKKRGRTGLTGGDDLSGLANLPFAEWFTWCMKCKHGGHAHHIVGWFANHGDTCPVSGCNCLCQSDTVQKQSRAGSKR